MQFRARQKRQAPAVIIISLIDILIVLLIFLMVTTTFKNFPALNISLPQVRQPKPGSSENLMIVTIQKQEPHYYLDTRAITLTKLQEELTRRAALNTNATLAVRPDKDSVMQDFLAVMEAANAAKIKTQVPVFVTPTK